MPRYYAGLAPVNRGVEQTASELSHIISVSEAIALYLLSLALFPLSAPRFTRSYSKMGSAQADVQLVDFGNIFRLDGKVAVVTGGSRGLGLHAASG